MAQVRFSLCDSAIFKVVSTLDKKEKKKNNEVLCRGVKQVCNLNSSENRAASSPTGSLRTLLHQQAGHSSQMRGLLPVFPTLKWRRQEDSKCKGCQAYLAISCLSSHDRSSSRTTLLRAFSPQWSIPARDVPSLLATGKRVVIH